MSPYRVCTLLILILSLFYPRDISFERIVGLFVWQPFSDGPRLILPAYSGVSFRQVAKLYHSRLKAKGPQAWGHLLSDPDFSWPLEQESMQPLDRSELNMLILANRLGHMVAPDPFPFVRQKIIESGGQAYLLPLSVDLAHVVTDEQNAFERLLMEAFDGLISIGGADIHPNIYGESKKYPGVYFYEIDQFEYQFVSKWVAQKTKPIYGICRGHQMLSILVGAEIIQDIETFCPQHVDHQARSSLASDQATACESNWHSIEFITSQSLLREALNADSVRVNSRHHQGVAYPTKRPLQKAKVVAISGDLVEAIELDDNLGFSVQFHPEDMHDQVGDRVMLEIIKHAEAFRKERLCQVGLGAA